MRNSATKESEKQGSELALLELQDWGTSGGCVAVTGRSLVPRLSVGLCAPATPQATHRPVSMASFSSHH